MNTTHFGLSNAQILERCASLLEEMDDALLGVEPMPPDEARHTAKPPREDGDTLVEEIARSCRAIDLERADRHTTVEAMLDDLRDARALREVLYKHDLARARLRALRMRLESTSWRSAMTFYALLRRAAAREPNVREGLEPVLAFFRRTRARRRERGRVLAPAAGSVDEQTS